MTAPISALDTRLETLDALAQTGWQTPALAQLFADWANKAFLVACQIRLSGTDSCHWYASGPALAPNVDAALQNAARIWEPELGPSAWKFPIKYQDRYFGELVLGIPDGTVIGVSPTLVTQFVEQFGRLLDRCREVDEAQTLALTDELTGLGNRRQLERSLRRSVDRARQEHRPLSLLFFDIDHFKEFNDTWGHEAGDEAIRLVGQIMQRVFRQDDIVCRFGGEEFAIILCGQRSSTFDQSPPREAMEFAKRLQQEGDRLALTAKTGQVLAPITMSGGIATFPWDAGTEAELMRAADLALYAAKRAGRNQICIASKDDSAIAIR